MQSVSDKFYTNINYSYGTADIENIISQYYNHKLPKFYKSEEDTNSVKEGFIKLTGNTYKQSVERFTAPTIVIYEIKIGTLPSTPERIIKKLLEIGKCSSIKMAYYDTLKNENDGFTIEYPIAVRLFDKGNEYRYSINRFSPYLLYAFMHSIVNNCTINRYLPDTDDFSNDEI